MDLMNAEERSQLRSCMEDDLNVARAKHIG
jgi:hypothetical protein